MKMYLAIIAISIITSALTSVGTMLLFKNNEAEQKQQMQELSIKQIGNAREIKQPDYKIFNGK